MTTLAINFRRREVYELAQSSYRQKRHQGLLADPDFLNPFRGRGCCERIRRWWFAVGRRRYPEARRLLIEADSGGSNDPRRWAWKVALQKFADESQLVITVTHYPPGASKWNPTRRS